MKNKRESENTLYKNAFFCGQCHATLWDLSFTQIVIWIENRHSQDQQLQLWGKECSVGKTAEIHFYPIWIVCISEISRIRGFRKCANSSERNAFSLHDSYSGYTEKCREKTRTRKFWHQLFSLCRCLISVRGFFPPFRS